MSGLCGWFDPTGKALVEPSVTQRMAEVLTRFDGARTQTLTGAWGAIAIAGHDGSCDAFQDNDRMVAVWGRARFEDADLARVQQEQGAARALAEGYERKGKGLLQAMRGHFAVALLDRRNGSALLAVDRTGVRSLCYADSEGKLVFGSNLDAMSAFPGLSSAINPQAIYDYVYFHMVPGPQTIYANRRRLVPGTYLSWRPSNAEVKPYWEMRYTEDVRRPFPELKEEFRSLLKVAVADSLDETTGAFLSGGTDSSTIAGILREVTGKAPRTYSIGFDAEGYDEMGYARIAARHFSADHHEYYVTPADVVSGIPMVAAVHDQPFGNSSAVPAYYCAKLAKDDGVDTLLGGDGGDELFGGNARYATQYLYSLYSDLPAGLRKGVIEPVLNCLPGLGPIGKVQRYVKTASIPMPERYDNYNLLERMGPANVFTAEFLSGVSQDAPRHQVASTYDAAHARSLINRMLALDMKYTVADNDLPKVIASCQLAGVASEFPMLDDRLVEFSASLAPDLKLRRTRLRYFFKEALRDLLPEQIILKKKHGFGLPFGAWLQSYKPLSDLAGDSLASLKTRNIIDPRLIDQLMSTHVKSHAAYFGTMVWILMMLELWLRERAN